MSADHGVVSATDTILSGLQNLNNNVPYTSYFFGGSDIPIWSDATIAINWETANKQLRFQIPSGTTWQGSSGGIGVSGQCGKGGGASFTTTGAVVTPLVALTNYYVAANAASGARVSTMDMTSSTPPNVFTGKMWPVDPSGVALGSYYLQIEVVTNASSVVGFYTITKRTINTFQF